MVKGGGDDEELDPDFYNFTNKSSKMVVDPVVLTELGELWSMAAPITLMNCVVFLRAMVSVLFLGRLGPLALAGGSHSQKKKNSCCLVRDETLIEQLVMVV